MQIFYLPKSDLGTTASVIHVFIHRKSTLAEPNSLFRRKWFYNSVTAFVYFFFLGIMTYGSIIVVDRSMLDRVEKAKRVSSICKICSGKYFDCKEKFNNGAKYNSFSIGFFRRTLHDLDL